MREIKFRVWNGNNYDYEGFAVYPDGRFEYPEGGWDLQGFYDDGILEQFTGIHDKNGKEIYEGDILATENDGKDGADKWELIVLPFVRWNNQYSRFDNMPDVEDESIYSMTYIKVIVNIHENPELINER